MTTRTQRLDELPFTAKHRRLLGGSGVGWALDAMDVGLISFVMAALAVQWNLSSTQLSWIGPSDSSAWRSVRLSVVYSPTASAAGRCSP